MGDKFKPLGLTKYDYYGNATHYLPISYSNNEINVGLPEVTITPRNNLDLGNTVREGMNNAARKGVEALSLVTPLGDVEDIYNIGKDILQDNYDEAALGAALMFLPGFISRPIKKATRLGKRFMRHSNKVGNEYYDYLDVGKIAEELANSALGYNRYYRIPMYEKHNLEGVTQNWRDAQRKNLALIDDEIYKYISTKLYDLNTASELITLFKLDPRYFDFIKTNNLDPFDQNTVNAFLKKQFTHIRGVNFPNNVNNRLVKRALTTNNKVNYGGDRLQTGNTGVYVSNSGEIADRFSRPNTYGSDTRSDVAIVTYPYNIDTTLPIGEQLAQARRKIFPYFEEFDPPSYKILSRHGYAASEAQYTTRKGNKLPGYERAYINKKLNKKLLNIEDQTTKYGLKDARGRWGLGGVSSVPELESKLFEGNNIGLSFGDYVHYIRTLMDPKNSIKMGLLEWENMYYSFTPHLHQTKFARINKWESLLKQFKNLRPYKIYKNVTDPSSLIRNSIEEAKRRIKKLNNTKKNEKNKLKIVKKAHKRTAEDMEDEEIQN